MTQQFQLSRYETWELDALIEQIERPNPWLLRTFFNREKLFASRSIEFDFLDRSQRRLAPFVSPFVSGKPTRREGFRTKSLSPAYIKPTDLVTPQESFTRMPGEAYGGQLTPQQRFDKLVANTLDRHIQMVDNTLEWMAAQALVTGGIVIQGEDYPATYVNFERDPSLFVQLVGASKWTQPTSNPIQDIENASIQTRIISKGAVVNTLVMDGLTWNVLKQHSAIQDMINIWYRRHLPGQQETSIDIGPRNTINEALFVGNLSGRFDLYVYDAYYDDDQGNSLPYLPPYTVLGIDSNALEGTQYFGAILDLHAAMQPRKLFSKSDVKFEPSGVELVTQSAPLVAPRRPDAMFTMTIA